MATFTVQIEGVPTDVPIPDGLSNGGAQDYLIQMGFEPAQVGLDLPEPDPIPLGMQFIIGAGEMASDLFQSTQQDIRAPQTTAANIGRGAMLAGPAMLLPATGAVGIGSQAAFSGTVSLARQRAAADDISEVSPLEAGGEAGATAVILGAFNGVTRVLGGLSRLAGSRFTRQPISLPRMKGRSKEAERAAGAMSRFARGSGALERIDTAQRRANNFSWGKAMGFSTRDARRIAALDDDTLATARQIVNEGYDAAAPTGPVAVAKVKEILTRLDEAGLPDTGVTSILRRIGEGDTLAAAEWQGVQRELRDVASRTRRNSVWSGLSGDVDAAINALDDAALAAGGDADLLRLANHRYKLLATTEEISDVLITEQLPVSGEMIRKLTRENFKGFGRRGTMEGTGNLDPDMQNFIDVQREVARFARETAGGSPTAARMASTGQAAKATVEGLTGTQNAAVSMFKAILSLGIPPLMAMAAIGESLPTFSRLIGAPLAQALPKLGFEPGGETMRELERRERAGEGLR